MKILAGIGVGDVCQLGEEHDSWPWQVDISQGSGTSQLADSHCGTLLQQHPSNDQRVLTQRLVQALEDDR